MKEEKVVYSVTKYGKYNSFRFTGLGTIKDKDLILKNNQILEDCIKDCHPIPFKERQFAGNYYEFNEIDVEDDNGRINTIEVQTEYKIWFKKLNESEVRYNG